MTHNLNLTGLDRLTKGLSRFYRRDLAPSRQEIDEHAMEAEIKASQVGAPVFVEVSGHRTASGRPELIDLGEDCFDVEPDEEH